jgi:hypothetical protein
MKKSILALISIFPMMGHAATCFKAQNPISAQSQLPQKICIESYSLRLNIPELPEVSNYIAKIKSDLGTHTQVVNKFETANKAFQVNVDVPLVKTVSGSCEGTYASKIRFSMLVDKKAQVVKDGLSVTGLEISNYDECHSKDEETLIRYEKM